MFRAAMFEPQHDDHQGQGYGRFHQDQAQILERPQVGPSLLGRRREKSERGVIEMV